MSVGLPNIGFGRATTQKTRAGSNEQAASTTDEREFQVLKKKLHTLYHQLDTHVDSAPPPTPPTVSRPPTKYYSRPKALQPPSPSPGTHPMSPFVITSPVFPEAPSELGPATAALPLQPFTEDAELRVITELEMTPLTDREIVLIKEAWRSTLSIKHTFAEALFYCWFQSAPEMYTLLGHNVESAQRNLLALIDMSVRQLRTSLYRDHQLIQVLVEESEDGFQTKAGYFSLYATLGIRPSHWISLRSAFLYAYSTHGNLSNNLLTALLGYKPSEGCTLKTFFNSCVLKPAFEALTTFKALLSSDLFVTRLPAHWEQVNKQQSLEVFSQGYFEKLLKPRNSTSDTDLLYTFRAVNIDKLSETFVLLLDEVIKTVEKEQSAAIPRLRALAEAHQMKREFTIPSRVYPILGKVLCSYMDSIVPVGPDIRHAWDKLFSVFTSVLKAPLTVEERMLVAAEKWLDQVTLELDWTEEKRMKRMIQIRSEIAVTGIYNHTFEELEYGAKVAWRNAPRCLGKASWNTILLRDCRHATTPKQMWDECKQHMQMATADKEGVIPIVTVFRPRKPLERWGPRIWNKRFIQYAAYKTADDVIVGDAANLTFTANLQQQLGWKAPHKKSSFDVLPLVIDVPGCKPHMFNISTSLVKEVVIEHPTNPKFTQLGLKWNAFPSCSNVHLELGGMDYCCCPYNGWSVDTQIATALWDRYNQGKAIGRCFELDVSRDISMWKDIAFAELNKAIVWSFRKNGISIVDHHTLANEYLSHVYSEHEAGREVPGGSVYAEDTGSRSLCPMFTELQQNGTSDAQPQFRKGANVWQVKAMPGTYDDTIRESEKIEYEEVDYERTRLLQPKQRRSKDKGSEKILILYGSETGTAERVAYQLYEALQPLVPTIATLNSYSPCNASRRSKLGIYSKIFAITSTIEAIHPRNADEFLSTDVPLPNLHHSCRKVQYAVLGLGNSCWENFCGFADEIDQAFSAAGGQRIVKVFKADEMHEPVVTIRRWVYTCERLLFPMGIANVQSIGTVTYQPLTDKHSWDSPNVLLEYVNPAVNIPPRVRFEGCVRCSVLKNEELLDNAIYGKNDIRSTRRIVIDITKTHLSYTTSDYVYIYPKNHLADVVTLCNVLGIEKDKIFKLYYVRGNDKVIAGGTQFPFPQPCSIELLFSWYYDITLTDTILIPLLTLIQHHYPNKEFDPLYKQLCSWLHVLSSLDEDCINSGLEGPKAELSLQQDIREKRQQLMKDIQDKYFFIADLLAEYSTCRVPLQELLLILEKQKCRYYTIGSSNKITPTHIVLTVGVLSIKTSEGPQGKYRHGTCSTYLMGLAKGEEIFMGIRKSQFTAAPKDATHPLILVSIGSSISPFMGILGERELLFKLNEKLGTCMLYYGCRKPSEVLYEALLNKWEHKGNVVSHLNITLSRSIPERRIHLHQWMISEGAKIWGTLSDPNCYFYAAGDGVMLRESYEALLSIIQTHADVPRITAVKHLDKMKTSGRYISMAWAATLHYHEAKEKLVVWNKSHSAETWLRKVATKESPLSVVVTAAPNEAGRDQPTKEITSSV